MICYSTTHCQQQEKMNVNVFIAAQRHHDHSLPQKLSDKLKKTNLINTRF